MSRSVAFAALPGPTESQTSGRCRSFDEFGSSIDFSKPSRPGLRYSSG